MQIHANICMRAVVVTETLDWRLHGLDLMTEHMATGDLPLMSASWMVGAQYKPSEIAKCEWGAIQQGPPWAVDSWGLGCLMQVSCCLCYVGCVCRDQSSCHSDAVHACLGPCSHATECSCSTSNNRKLPFSIDSLMLTAMLSAPLASLASPTTFSKPWPSCQKLPYWSLDRVLMCIMLLAGSLQWAGDGVNGGAQKHSTHPQTCPAGMLHDHLCARIPAPQQQIGCMCQVFIHTSQIGSRLEQTNPQSNVLSGRQTDRQTGRQTAFSDAPVLLSLVIKSYQASFRGQL